MSIKDNYDAVMARISEAAKKSGRSGDNIRLVAVTKTVSISEMKELIECGAKAFGESRVKLAATKFEFLKKEIETNGIEKHMIGHLQSNKVKLCVKEFDVIQSVDSYSLANKINTCAIDEGKIMKIMLQINVSGEEQKYGLSEEDILEVYKKIMGLSNVKVIGLMCMAPWIEAEDTRPYFKKAKEIADELKMKELSMGMTNDFEVAVEEGSTIVRVGRALFK